MVPIYFSVFLLINNVYDDSIEDFTVFDRTTAMRMRHGDAHGPPTIFLQRLSS